MYIVLPRLVPVCIDSENNHILTVIKLVEMHNVIIYQSGVDERIIFGAK
jgi:hypothetical protein